MRQARIAAIVVAVVLAGCKAQTERIDPVKWQSIVRVGPSALYAAGSITLSTAETAAIVWRTEDQRNWVDVSPPTSMGLGDIGALSVTPDGTLLFGVANHGTELVRSSNGGANWSVVSYPGNPGNSCFLGNIPSGIPGALVVQAPSDPKRFYAACNFLPPILMLTTNGGSAWRVLDPSATDVELYVEEITAIAVDPANPLTVYVAGDLEGDEAAVSTDGGLSWKGRLIIDGGPLPGGYAGLNVLTSSSNPSVLLLSAIQPEDPGGPGPQPPGYLSYRSTNGGLSFVPVEASWSSEMEFVADPVAPAVIYDHDRAGGGQVLFTATVPYTRSEDGGQTWIAISNDLPGPPAVLVPDPVTEGTLFAIVGGQVYKSINNEVHWSLVPIP